jgi:ATP-dependent DNA helicase RecG
MTKLPINLSDLLRQRTVEGERIEYKTGWNPDAIMRTVCAFANDFENLGGGYVVIGQDCDAHGQPVFPPVGLADNQLDKIQQELLSLAAKVPFDDRYLQAARVDDVSQPLMQAFLQEVGSALAADAPGLSVEALARQMHVAGGPTESPWPKNVGLLFFNETPEQFFPGLQIDVVWFPEGAGGNRFEEKIFKGPLARMTREALGYIQRNFLGETVIKHPDRAEATRVWNFPYAAIEEALVNAVYHRSYEEREPIEVRISHEELVIVRFPGPDRSIRLADLQAGRAVSRRYRNRRIGEFLKELDMTEGRSTGIPKILKAMAANGSPAPLFETDDDRLAFVIRLPRHPLSLVPSADTTQVTGEVAGEVDRLLRAVEGEMSRQQIQAALGLKSEEHFRTTYLKPALQAAVVEMTVPDKPNSRHQRYRLTPLGQRWLQTLPSPAKPTSPHP